MFLLKWQMDWADEFDMTGMEVLTPSEWQNFQASVQNANYPVEAGFGTNEYYEFRSADEVMSGFKVIEITDDEAETLKRLFGNRNYFGWTPVGHF